MTTLRTARLVLRHAREADVAAMHEVMRDAETMRYWSTLPHETIETTRAWMRAMIDAPETSADFVIEHDGLCVGKVGFFRMPEIGFILRRDRWGRGLMHEAARAAIDHVLAAHAELSELRADVDPRNDASLKLLARLGFVETHRAERTYQISGVWSDSVYLAMRRR